MVQSESTYFQPVKMQIKVAKSVCLNRMRFDGFCVPQSWPVQFSPFTMKLPVLFLPLRLGHHSVQSLHENCGVCSLAIAGWRRCKALCDLTAFLP